MDAGVGSDATDGRASMCWRLASARRVRRVRASIRVRRGARNIGWSRAGGGARGAQRHVRARVPIGRAAVRRSCPPGRVCRSSIRRSAMRRRSRRAFSRLGLRLRRLRGCVRVRGRTNPVGVRILLPCVAAAVSCPPLPRRDDRGRSLISRFPRTRTPPTTAPRPGALRFGTHRDDMSAPDCARFDREPPPVSASTSASMSTSVSTAAARTARSWPRYEQSVVDDTRGRTCTARARAWRIRAHTDATRGAAAPVPAALAARDRPPRRALRDRHDSAPSNSLAARRMNPDANRGDTDRPRVIEGP